MSRYVEVELAQGSIGEVCEGLRRLGIAYEHTGDALLLGGGIECAGQPALVRVPAGTLGAVEDFGFVEDASGCATLVCGEPDRGLLRTRLVAPLQLELAQLRLAADAGLALGEAVREVDGRVRLTLRPRR